MSQTRAAHPTAPNRAQRQGAENTRRRRRWGFGGAAAAIGLIAAVILGLHFANRPSATATGPGTTTSAALPQPGHTAPAGSFTTLAGKNVNIASLRGQPTLVWFVATWCSSCQAGTQALAQNIAKLRSDGVRVDEVELYQDLGQSGPSLASFAKSLAGPQYGNPDWTFGTSSAALTRAYDPNSYLDIYYLLNTHGQITYVNGSPAATMPQLLAAAAKLA